MNSNADSPNPISFWRFWIPLVFQTALILAVPAQAVYTQFTGKTVYLQTVPIDPYELLRGYSQTLRYDISSQDSLRKLPGWRELPKQQPNGNKLAFIKPGTRFYVILEAPAKPNRDKLPQPWKPVAVTLKRPSALPDNQVTLQGIAENGLIQYGLETYYIPEDQREDINADLREARKINISESPEVSPPLNSPQLQQKPPVVMEIKVNTNGEAVPISLWARLGEASKQQVRRYNF